MSSLAEQATKVIAASAVVVMVQTLRISSSPTGVEGAATPVHTLLLPLADSAFTGMVQMRQRGLPVHTVVHLVHVVT